MKNLLKCQEVNFVGKLEEYEVKQCLLSLQSSKYKRFTE